MTNREAAWLLTEIRNCCAADGTLRHASLKEHISNFAHRNPDGTADLKDRSSSEKMRHSSVGMALRRVAQILRGEGDISEKSDIRLSAEADRLDSIAYPEDKYYIDENDGRLYCTATLKPVDLRDVIDILNDHANDHP